jgi:glutamyl-tRNA reductase
MSIILVGLNHRTAPVEIREQLSLDDASLSQALDDLAGRCNDSTGRLIQQAVIVSTCNRLEIYAFTQDVAVGWTCLEKFLAEQAGQPPGELHQHFYRLSDESAIRHLMRVTCGLDSQILGEPQILGQVRHAFEQARSGGHTGPELSYLMSRALHAGKRARHETNISRATTSVSHAAIDLASAKFGDLSQARVLLVGAGEMMHLAAKALQHRGVANTACINRTHARALGLAQMMDGQAFSWNELPHALTWADVVITGTGAPHTVIHAEDIQPVLEQRNGRPLILVDIAVPRDVEEAVGDLPGVHRYDIDALRATLDAHLAFRRAAIPQVEQIITEEMDDFLEWSKGRQVVPVIVAMRQKVKAVAQQELQLALQQMPELDEAQKALVGKLVHRLTNKILHEPTVTLKANASNGKGADYVRALVDLFALEQVNPEEVLPKTPVNSARRATNGFGKLRNGHANYAPEMEA